MSVADDLTARAHAVRVVVVGGGVSGLVAALECAKVGFAVTVLEESDRFGGVLRSAELDGTTVDVGAESYATRGGHVRALIDELGLGDAVTAPAAGAAWVAGLPGGAAAPLPKGGVLGIPANAWAADVRAVIGWAGAWRAYLDRLRPPLTIGHERSLGALVRTRMGERVLHRLVAPVTTGVYSARPDDIDVDLAAPGLNSALTRTGSLSGAVAALRGDGAAAEAGRAHGAGAPGSAVAGLVGGMTTLIDALQARLVELGVDLRVASPVMGLDRDGDGDGDGWRVSVEVAAEAPAEGAEDEVEVLAADAVIVAVSETVARRILAPVVPALSREPGTSSPGPVVEVITLVVDAPALDAHPRGTGVLTVPGSSRAKALTHSTAKWPWLAKESAHHIVRVSFGTQGEAPATEGMSDDEAAALALTEASALLGVPLSPASLRAAHRERYEQSQPASTIGRADVVTAARRAITAVDGLGVVGAWLAGTGLAQVVPDAIAEADRVRHAALWG